jgi:uncharacterized protein (TIGR02453 family)
VPIFDAPVCSGFGRGLFSLFDEPAKNQNKGWFHVRKDEYDTQARAPMQLLVEDLSARFSTQLILLSGNAKTSGFRINRNTRFSKRKSPYKANIGAILSETGAPSVDAQRDPPRARGKADSA